MDTIFIQGKKNRNKGSENARQWRSYAVVAAICILLTAAILLMGGCGKKNGQDTVVIIPTDAPEITDAAGTDGPASDEPVLTDAPATDEPVLTDDPATEVPATGEPATDEPATDEPVLTDEPATLEPATDVPATGTPVPPTATVPAATKTPDPTATQAPTPTVTTRPTATQAPTPVPYDEADNIFKTWNTSTLNAFKTTTGKQTDVTLTSDGIKFTYTASAGADPFVFFDLEKYQSVSGKNALSGSNGAYIVMKVKCDNGDGDMEVFTHKPASGDSTKTCYTADGNWHYVLADMTGTTFTKPDKLTKVRIDWSGINTKKGATMVLSEISFYSNYNDAMKAAGLEEYILKDASSLSISDPLANKVLTAANEEASVKLWFDYPTERVLRTVTTAGSMKGYTVYMAKNEAENAQFFVAPGRAVNLKVEVDPFTDGKGNTLDFELAYEYYHNVGGKYTPDGLIPYTGPVSVAANNSQGFVIRLTSLPSTKAGTYNSVVHIYDNDTGKEIKRAAVAARVWNVELSEETVLRTAFAMSEDQIRNSYSDQKYTQEQKAVLYDSYYAFFLKYRINIMDVPHGLTSGYAANNVLNNPRVNTVRWRNLDWSIKDDNDGVWPDWMDKVFYYTVDEPGARNNIATDMATLLNHANTIRANTPQFRMVCPIDRNLDLTADGKSSSFANSATDMIGYMQQATNIWCVKMDAFTPRELRFVKGSQSLQSMDQDIKYGTFSQRMKARVEQGDELWAYVAINPTEPYVNWQLSSDGTEAVTTMWQLYQNDITGLLYWTVNYWKVNYWGTSPWSGDGSTGDGMLIYSGYSFDLTEPIPTMRLELIRDGIEDYQLLSMLEDKLGREAVDELISYISTSVVTFTSDNGLIRAVRAQLGRMLEEAMN